jgi:tetratricopeptide (TPR) repeat protein
LVDVPDGSASTAVRISSITGMAGIGKTALAVHWAHRVADRFPDGQLYVNLRGFDPSERIMEPAQAVRILLDAFGVPAVQIPVDPEAQAALYRTLLADRNVLVVLDNARDSEQVRPLLPGGSTCLVLVTSRGRLTGLVASGAARPLILGPLPVGEARDLLAARLGAGRVDAEPAAARAIVARCAGLPLALALTAARVATYPMSLTTAAELDDEHLKLDTLDAGDPATDVRAVFSWSYRALTPPAARLFRLLGLHPGPDIALAAVASLAATPVRQVRPLLIELGDAGLITETAGGRYVIHDLLRAYAAELAGSGDGRESGDDSEGHAGLRRLLDHYVHTAYAAALLLKPRRDPIALPPAAPGVESESLADVDGAVRWFTREHQVLTDAVHAAAAAGFDAHTWQLAWTLNDFLYKQGHWRDRITTYLAALAAGQRLADRKVRIAAHHGLAGAYLRLGADADADAHLRAEVELLREDGDRVAQARAHLGIAQLMDRRARHDAARDHATEAMTLYRTAGHRTGQATALNMIGWCKLRLGNPERAVTYCKQAIEIQEQTADPEAASTWDTLGCAYQELGRHVRAADCFRRALDLSRTVGDRYYEAFVLGHLGDTHHAAGDDAAARNAWQTALDVFTRFGHPDAAELRKKIDGLPDPNGHRTQKRHNLVRSLTQR